LEPNKCKTMHTYLGIMIVEHHRIAMAYIHLDLDGGGPITGRAAALCSASGGGGNGGRDDNTGGGGGGTGRGLLPAVPGVEARTGTFGVFGLLHNGFEPSNVNSNTPQALQLRRCAYI
jgi:hypothetical protein